MYASSLIFITGLFVSAAALALLLGRQQLLQLHVNSYGQRREHIPLQQLQSGELVTDSWSAPSFSDSCLFILSRCAALPSPSAWPWLCCCVHKLLHGLPQRQTRCPHTAGPHLLTSAQPNTHETRASAMTMQFALGGINQCVCECLCLTGVMSS